MFYDKVTVFIQQTFTTAKAATATVATTATAVVANEIPHSAGGTHWLQLLAWAAAAAAGFGTFLGILFKNYLDYRAAKKNGSI